jgi:CRP/FNR family transcriptional regulator
MISYAEFASLVHAYPELAELGLKSRKAFIAAATARDADRGEAVFQAAAPCESAVWLVSGRVRVVARASSGRELLLYRIGPGEVCILGIASLLGHSPYPAHAEVEEPVHAICLPASSFEDLLQSSAELRNLVFRTLASRMRDLMSTLEALAFHRLDQRLARALVARTQNTGSGELRCTHQTLADELGTAREMVSRILEDFESSGLLRLGRGRIVVENLPELKAREQAG